MPETAQNKSGDLVLKGSELVDLLWFKVKENQKFHPTTLFLLLVVCKKKKNLITYTNNSFILTCRFPCHLEWNWKSTSLFNAFDYGVYIEFIENLGHCIANALYI